MSALPVLPSFVVIVPLLVAFVMLMVKYYILNPARRVTDHHFLLGLGAVVVMMAYLVMANRDPADGAVSCAFAVAGAAWLAISYWLFRLKPPKPEPAGFTLGKI